MNTYGERNAIEDRDLSRAAAERHLMLQALPERAGGRVGRRHLRVRGLLGTRRALRALKSAQAGA